ncbi:hypothetical protein ACS5PN_25710 [Roseateles sp. NT4]|uniref:hypothetical protein n=1 Tax=Roseateles sp. NT4 TaxID=3453715 RepID=UPI003EEDBE64
MEMSALGVGVAAGTASVIAIGIIVTTWNKCCGKADRDEGLAKGKAQGGKGSASGSATQQGMTHAQAKKILNARHLGADAAKKLAAACQGLRDVKRHLIKYEDLDERIEFANELEPAFKDMRDKASALDMITGRHEKLLGYVSNKVFFKHKISDLLAQAKIAREHYEKGLATLQTDYAKLQRRAADIPEPPVRKDFNKLYGSDEDAGEDEAKFDRLSTDLDDAFNKLLENSRTAEAYFRTEAFDEMRWAIDMLARMDKRMRLEDKEHVKKGKSAKVEAEEEDPEPPKLPRARTDEYTGLTFRVVNPDRDADDELTDAEQDKVEAFAGLDGTELRARLRDLMNDHFGKYEYVNHHTVRLSRRRRLEFNVAVTATEVQATIVHIGDPTYAH